MSKSLNLKFKGGRGSCRPVGTAWDALSEMKQTGGMSCNDGFHLAGVSEMLPLGRVTNLKETVKEVILAWRLWLGVYTCCTHASHISWWAVWA